MSKHQQQQQKSTKAEIQRVKDAIAAETNRLREIRRFERNFHFEVSTLTERIGSIQKRLAELHSAMASCPKNAEEAIHRIKVLREKYVKLALQPQLEKLRQLREVLKEEGDV